MTRANDTRADDIESRAIQWILRRELPDFTSADQAELDAWISENPRNRVAYLRMEAVWNRTERLKLLKPLDDTVEDDIRALAEQYFRPASEDSRWSESRRRWLAAAAVAFVVAGAAWITSVIVSPWERFRTETGGLRHITLEDGSRIQLNTDTELRVRMSESQREVILERGEALFYVARDERRSFHVIADGTVVRAVGTAFSVRLRENRRVDVLVSEGRVVVGTQGSPDRLVEPGFGATVNPSSIDVLSLGMDEVNRRLAWTMGEIRLKRETLAEAVAEFNRYNRRRIVIQDQALAGLRLGGTFQATDPESFAAAVSSAYGVQVVYPRGRDDEIHLLGPEQRAD